MIGGIMRITTCESFPSLPPDRRLGDSVQQLIVVARFAVPWYGAENRWLSRLLLRLSTATSGRAADKAHVRILDVLNARSSRLNSHAHPRPHRSPVLSRRDHPTFQNPCPAISSMLTRFHLTPGKRSSATTPSFPASPPATPSKHHTSPTPASLNPSTARA